MPSPIRSGGDPAPINPGSADAVSDLPASQWPSMERIAVVDLVGPSAANRQVRALQRRTRVLADNLNRNTAVLNFVSGDVAVPGDYARKVQAAGTVPLSAGDTQVADDLEHYLARDGSSVMWGRLNLGHTRSLMYTSAFDVNANHWVQGPGSANVAMGDFDRIWGIKRLNVNDYELYVWRLSSPYRVLTTYDFPAGPETFLYSGSNNDRVVTTVGGAALMVEASYAATSTPAKLGVAITGQSSLYLRALKGNAAYTDICREGTTGYNGAMMRFEGSQATRAYPFIYSKPISVSAGFGFGIAIGHAPFGLPVEWSSTDYGYQTIQSVFGDPLRFAFGTRQSVGMTNGDSTLAVAATCGANSCVSVLSPGSSYSRPSYGFVKVGSTQCALYYDGDVSTRPDLKVMASDGDIFTLAYREDLSTVAFTGAYGDLTGKPSLGGRYIADVLRGGHTRFTAAVAGTYLIVMAGGGGGGGGGGKNGGGSSGGGADGGAGGGAGRVVMTTVVLAAGDYIDGVLGAGGTGGAATADIYNTAPTHGGTGGTTSFSKNGGGTLGSAAGGAGGFGGGGGYGDYSYYGPGFPVPGYTTLLDGSSYTSWSGAGRYYNGAYINYEIRDTFSEDLCAGYPYLTLSGGNGGGGGGVFGRMAAAFVTDLSAYGMHPQGGPGNNNYNGTGATPPNPTNGPGTWGCGGGGGGGATGVSFRMGQDGTAGGAGFIMVYYQS